ncbi:hypothetical protein K466DRAFT_173540 [Polyporus arcularius HHB13444]|uniref:Uncharacterized protein n=1 Tax=Polyporus arcularius HHB13444 TaxID=1314778 RepID=A0A5C3PB75_9APHY|nr:hypothetical protein K466DRAFT_173540 [Polyporus arcularius HHB13444]
MHPFTQDTAIATALPTSSTTAACTFCVSTPYVARTYLSLLAWEATTRTCDDSRATGACLELAYNDRGPSLCAPMSERRMSSATIVGRTRHPQG